MDGFNSAAAALKQSVGLPSNVNPAAASLPAAGTQNAQGQAVSQPPLQKSAEEVLALKDQALNEANERIKALEAANEQGLNAVAQMIEAKLNPKVPPKAPEPPPLPENLSDLPAEEQIRLIAKHEAAKEIQSAVAAEREAMMNAIGPVLMRANQSAEETDRLAVKRKYPQFDYDKMKPEMDKIGKELPGTSVLERVVLVAQKTGSEAQLLPPPPQAPASIPAIPSLNTAAGTMNASPQDSRARERELWSKAADHGMKRQSVEQGMYIDEILKMRGFGMPKP